MTPKKKAKELVNEMSNWVEGFGGDVLSKKCALIAVDLRIKAYINAPVGSIDWAEENESYWQQVKNEIELL